MPIYNVAIMSQTKEGEIGKISGIMGNVQSLMMVFGPLLAGLLLAQQINIFYGGLFVLCGVQWGG